MRVSIIIPAYNAEATLAATLASARQQTWPDLEIIVVNDGSQDRTLDIIRAARSADARIVLVDQANSGVAEARNAGLRLASGDLIAILDADDIWHPTKIAKQVARFKSAPADTVAVYCWSRVIDENDNVIATLPGLVAEGTILARHAYENVTGNGSTVLVRRDVATSVGFSDAMRQAGVPGTDDHLFQMKVAERGAYAVVPEYLVGYRRLSSACTADKARMARSVKLCLETFRKDNNQVPPFVYRWSEAAFSFDLVGYHLRQGKVQAALKCLWTACRLDPEMVLDRARKYALKRVRDLAIPNAGVVFQRLSPTANIVVDSGLHGRRMRKLAQIDATLKPPRQALPSLKRDTASYARV